MSSMLQGMLGPQRTPSLACANPWSTSPPPCAAALPRALWHLSLSACTGVQHRACSRFGVTLTTHYSHSELVVLGSCGVALCSRMMAAVGVVNAGCPLVTRWFSAVCPALLFLAGLQCPTNTTRRWHRTTRLFRSYRVDTARPAAQTLHISNGSARASLTRLKYAPSACELDCEQIDLPTLPAQTTVNPPTALSPFSRAMSH